MKINPSHISKAMEIYKAQRPTAPRADRKGQQKQDQVVLSDKAQAFQLALKALQDDDGIDMAKVEAIRKQIAEGEYKINPQEIAEKIVDDLLSKKRV
ncbi:MAG TPA: flagellar biosynthesis anti-sigma factor FlgM [Clostridia bacterium]|nr:flagellar biosynthesis anti-sigma factor FlgM [Clostridia bacterium]